MNKKRLTAFIIAVFLILSCSFTVFAFSGGDFFELFQYIENVKDSLDSSVSLNEWGMYNPRQRQEYFDNFCAQLGGTPVYTQEKADIFFSDEYYEGSYFYLLGLGGGFLDNNDVADNLAYRTTDGIATEMGLCEKQGLYDFGLGIYDSSVGHHSSGSFADTLNDDFMDYVQNNPYTGGGKLFNYDNGYYVTYKYGPDGSYGNFGVDGVIWHIYHNYLTFELHTPEGAVCDTVNFGYRFGPTIGHCCPDEGHYGILSVSPDSASNRGFIVVYEMFNNSSRTFSQTSKTVTLPWDFGTPFPGTDGYLPATGVDDDGDTVDITVTPNGVIYNGDTYTIDNSDNSVLINENHYHITINPKDVNDDYYKQFLQQTINNYYNTYKNDSTPFDDTNIINAIKSVHTSIETFRAYTHSQLQEIISYLKDIPRSISNNTTRIINVFQNGDSSDPDDVEVYHQNLENKINDKFGNLLKLRQLVERAMNVYSQSNVTSIDFTLRGFSYSIDFSQWFSGSTLDSFRFALAAFIYVSFAFNTFRRIPAYINNGGDR